MHPGTGLDYNQKKVNIPGSKMLPNDLEYNGFCSPGKDQILGLKIFGN